MITQVLHCAGRFISQHTAPNIPHLPASTPSSLSPCSSPKPWPKPYDCTLGLACVCVCTCTHVCLFVHAITWLCACCSPCWLMGICATAKTWWCHFCRCMVRSCQLLICLSLCTAISDVDLSWPVCVWSRAEQRRLCCVLCSGLARVCLEGRG